jgi:uncharacterized glyoxalase superfamily protein PhnB
MSRAHSISAILLYVRDLPRSAEFYKHLLDAIPSETNDSVVVFDVGPGKLVLHLEKGTVISQRSDLDTGVGVIVHFAVADVDDEYRRLTSIGITISMPPTDQTFGRRQMYLYDPDGYNVVIEQLR